MDYPIVLRLKGQSVLIIGGGKTAYRKAKKISHYPIKLTIYSPTFIKEFDQLAFKKIEKEFSLEMCSLLDGFDLIFAATNNKKLNQGILEYCSEKRILVNSVTHKTSDFIVPASFKIDDLTVSISTAGKAPFLSRQIKKDLEKKYTISYLELLFKIRKLLKQQKSTEKIYDLLALSEEELRSYYEENNSRG